MSFRSFLFLTLACLICSNEASDVQKILPQARVILQKFLNLVETNQLNVSVVTSRAQHWSNGQVQQIADSALLLPPNSVVLTQSQLSEQVGNQWLSELAPWTSQGHGIATHRVISFQNGEIIKKSEISSNLQGVPMSESLENILEPLGSNETELVEDAEDYEIMYNYIVPGVNNVNLTTSVLAVSLNIKILENSPNMPLTQINKMKLILSKIWMMIWDKDLLVQYLQEALNDRLPSSNTTWQVLINPQAFYIPNGKWVNLGIFDTNVVIFALDS